MRQSKLLRRVHVRGVLLAVGFVIGIVGAGTAVVSRLDPYDDEPFDRGRWGAAHFTDRLPMARAATHHVPAGVTEEAVVSVLGRPDGIEESQRLTAHPSAGAVRTYSYSLGGSGASSLWGRDSAFVWVHVGADGRVIKAVIGGG